MLAATENATNQWPLFMQLLAQYGKLNMIKALSPLLSNPNGTLLGNEDKKTPIYLASRHGQLEIIKFLEPLSENLTVDALQSAIDNATVHFDGVKYPEDIIHHENVVKYLESCIAEKSDLDLKLTP